MTQPEGDCSSTTDASERFRTTAWSTIEQAAQNGDPALALDAWEHLCRAYWRPVYAHIRRWGNPPELAKDLTQDFFHHLLRRERLKRADRSRGKFRSFLLATLNHFLHSEWDRRIARKRDERVVISLDAADLEGAVALDPAGSIPPDRAFERDWAASLFVRVRESLARELEAQGKQTQLLLLPAALHESPSVPYKNFGEQLQLSEDNVKKSVQRLRERWGAILRQHVMATVEHPEEVDEEIRFLLRIMAN